MQLLPYMSIYGSQAKVSSASVLLYSTRHHPLKFGSYPDRRTNRHHPGVIRKSPPFVQYNERLLFQKSVWSLYMGMLHHIPPHYTSFRAKMTQERRETCSRYYLIFIYCIAV